MKLYKIRRCATAGLTILAVSGMLMSCRGRNAPVPGDGDPEEAAQDFSVPKSDPEGVSPAAGNYGYVTASEAGDNESAIYGIMHAEIIEIDGPSGDTGTVYCLMDKADPDNMWSVMGLEIGYMGAGISVGEEVAVFFNGDIVNDYENVEFLVIVPEGEYRIKRISGRTTGSMMNSFTVESSGTEVVFIRDNCRMDERSLVSDGGESVIIYYAEGSEANYPLRIFSGKG